MSARAAAATASGLRPPDVRAVLADARHRRDAQALLTFAADGFAYAAGLAAAALAQPLALKLLFSLWSALFITRLFVLAHDACHGSFLTSQRLNRLVGRLGFLPSLTPFNLWQLGHNTLHHGFTNLKGRDYVWTPLSRAEFAALSGARQRLERLYRGIFGHGLYYLIEIWWIRMIWPARRRGAGQRRFDQQDRMLVLGYAALLLGSARWVALATSQSPALVLGATVLLPFALWNMVMGFLIFLHHTHPAVAWFDKRAEWKSHAPQLRQAIHVAFPSRVDAVVHHIMEHTAHHVDTQVPLYRLPKAQAALEARYPTEVPVQPFSWAYFRQCVRVCKLYDYEHHRWLDFEGRVTAQVPGPADPRPAAFS